MAIKKTPESSGRASRRWRRTSRRGKDASKNKHPSKREKTLSKKRGRGHKETFMNEASDNDFLMTWYPEYFSLTPPYFWDGNEYHFYRNHAINIMRISLGVKSNGVYTN